MGRAEKIDAIRSRRAQNATKTETLGAHLADIETALLELERVRGDLLTRIEDEPLARLSALAPALRELIDKTALERAALDRALARLRRTTLNIGVVGRARQGKSRFLQSLTGLTSREIPDGSGHFCTGVPSMIRHFPGATYADIFYHSERSFLDEVVGPYYDRYGLGARPVSPRAFGKGALPRLPAENLTPQAESAYGHLTAYHEAFGEYGALIGRTSPERVGDDRIRRFVAQDDVDGRPLHTFRAVRRVEISTPFEQEDLSGVTVIDLPGLGDTNLGDSRVLLSALEDDVDLVLFLRRPNPEGDGIHEFDVDLYGIAQRALPEIPMERRSFLILNHRDSVDQDNLASCRSFQAQVENSPIRVAGVRVADCSKTAEAVAAFDPIVDYLVDNIESLDQTIIGERVRRVAEIEEEARLLIREASAFAGSAQPGDRSFSTFLDLFHVTYQELAVAIKQLVWELGAERDAPDHALGEAVTQVIAQAREHDGIPTVTEIARRGATEGSNVATFSHLLDESRARLSRHFLGLEDALRHSVQQMWDRVAETLRGAGKLKHLSDRTGRDFLVDLAEMIGGQVRADGTSEVRYALEIVTDFNLSYRGFFQHRIRPCLDGMNADAEEVILQRGEASPQDIREALDIVYHEALYKCENALADLLAEPNGAVFAIVEEFSDRVLRSRRTQDEWRAFYWPFRAEIWTGTFAALDAETVHIRTWNEAIQRLNELL